MAPIKPVIWGRHEVQTVQWDGPLPDCLESLLGYLRSESPLPDYTVAVLVEGHGEQWMVMLLEEV